MITDCYCEKYKENKIIHLLIGFSFVKEDHDNMMMSFKVENCLFIWFDFVFVFNLLIKNTFRRSTYISEIFRKNRWIEIKRSILQ